MQDHILGHHPRLKGALKAEVHGLRNLDQQLARAHDEAGVGIADAGGELVERPRHAGVRIGAEEDFARPGMPLLRQGGMADSGVVRAVLPLQEPLGRIKLPLAIWIVDDVVEVRQILLLGEGTQDIHVAVGQGISGENVVVGNDDHPFAVPYLGILAKFAAEHTNGAGPADVMGH